MSKFHFPKRFDPLIATDGVWFEIYDENDNHWGDFKCAYLDQTSPRWKVAVERLTREYKNITRLKNFDVIVFVEVALLDWKLNGPDGKPIPFSKKDAIDYFSQEEAAYVAKELSAMASNVKNFQPAAPEPNKDGEVETDPKKG